MPEIAAQAVPLPVSAWKRCAATSHAVPGATLLLQALFVAIAFPAEELLTATPLLHIDAAHHWYEVKVAAELAQQGKLVGYDPFFAAGYLGGIAFNTSARVPALIAALFGPAMSAALAFKLFSVVCAIAGPAALPAAARKLGLHAGIQAATAALGLMLWWASPLHWYHTAGIVAWPLAVFGALWFAAATAAFMCGNGRVRTLIALPLAALALNLPWIWAMLANDQPGMANGMQPYQQAVDINMVWRDMLGLPSAGRGAKCYFFLVFLALWGVIPGPDGRLRRLAATLLVAAIVTVVFAAIGSAWPLLARVQTNRFTLQGYMMLVIPAALGAFNIARALADMPARAGNGITSTGMARMRAIVTMFSAAFGVAALAFFSREVWRELHPGAQAYYGTAPPEVRGPGPLTLWSQAQLQQHTDVSARVMFEQSAARIHDGGHMAGYLAAQTDREFIGGAYPYLHFANFLDDTLFGSASADLAPARLRHYLALYNVGWMLVHSDRVKRYLTGFSEIVPIAGRAPLVLYRVDAPHSFFLQGTGRVVARSINRIDLDDLEGQTIILKYHFVPGLQAQPPAAIDGVLMPGDPQPFIRITRPPKALRLSVQ
jgi:hypothetical protein